MVSNAYPTLGLLGRSIGRAIMAGGMREVCAGTKDDAIEVRWSYKGRVLARPSRHGTQPPGAWNARTAAKICFPVNKTTYGNFPTSRGETLSRIPPTLRLNTHNIALENPELQKPRTPKMQPKGLAWQSTSNTGFPGGTSSMKTAHE